MADLGLTSSLVHFVCSYGYYQARELLSKGISVDYVDKLMYLYSNLHLDSNIRTRPANMTGARHDGA